MAQALYRRPVRMRKPPPTVPPTPCAPVRANPDTLAIAPASRARKPPQPRARTIAPPSEDPPTPQGPLRNTVRPSSHPTRGRRHLQAPPSHPQPHPLRRSIRPPRSFIRPLRTLGQPPRDPQFFAPMSHPRGERVQSDQGLPSVPAPANPPAPVRRMVEPKAIPIDPVTSPDAQGDELAEPVWTTATRLPRLTVGELLRASWDLSRGRGPHDRSDRPFHPGCRLRPHRPCRSARKARQFHISPPTRRRRLSDPARRQREPNYCRPYARHSLRKLHVGSNVSI